MKTLFVNACIRHESRTKLLADYLIDKIGGDIKEVELSKSGLTFIDEEFLQKRQKYISLNQFEDPIFSYAKDFAEADTIVIASPYYDLSFSSLLKIYIEHITVSKLTFDITSNGNFVPLCKAKKLYYVTTKGGYCRDDFGYEYIKAMCNDFYGIKDTFLIKAEGLDIDGQDIEGIINDTKGEIDSLF